MATELSQEQLHKRMRAIARLDGKHSRASKGEAMALRLRSFDLYEVLKPHTTLRESEIVSMLLEVHPVTLSRWRNGIRSIGKRVWSTLKMAEIAAQHDPEAVLEYIESKVEVKKAKKRGLLEHSIRNGGKLMAICGLLASPLSAQIVVPEGDTLDIRVVTGQDTLVVTDTLTLTDTLTVTDTLVVTVTDTVTIVRVDTVLVGGDTPTVPQSRLALSDSNGTLVGRWTDIHGVANIFRLGPNSSGVKLIGSYWMCVNSSCNSQTMGTLPPIGFRFPASVPMEAGLMRQAVFPLDDIRPISDFVATLDGQAGTPLPDNLGWYWLPAPATGEITITGSN